MSQRTFILTIVIAVLTFSLLENCGQYHGIVLPSKTYSEKSGVNSSNQDTPPALQGKAAPGSVSDNIASVEDIHAEDSNANSANAPGLPAQPTPISTPLAQTNPCAGKGVLPQGLRLVYNSVKGGLLTIEGDDNANTVTVTGGGGPGVIRLVGATPQEVYIVPCVTDLALNGNGGDDVLAVGDGFPGVANINITGGAGNNKISLFGSVSATGNITIN